MKTTLKLTMIATAAILTACGGGGGGGNAVTPAPGQNAAVQTYVPLVTSVPAPSYSGTAALGKAAVLNYWNQQRQQCGLGLLKQSAELDKSGDNHAAYYQVQQAINPKSEPHYETAGKPAFTGVNPSDRALAVGYKTTGNEVLENGSYFNQSEGANTNPSVSLLQSPDSVYTSFGKDVLSAPYHSMFGALGPVTEVGLGLDLKYSTPTITMGNTTISLKMENYVAYLEFGYGMNGMGQTPATGTGVHTYPCEGSVDVAPGFWGEWLPYGGQVGKTGDEARNFALTPISSPIYILGEPNKTLVINSVNVIEVGSGTPQTVYDIRTQKTDAANSQYYRNDWTGFAWMNKPFAPGKSYSVTAFGTSGGVAFTRNFTFTAGKFSIADETTAKNLGLPI